MTTFTSGTSIENLYPALTECFAIIICGYFAGRMNYISETEAKGINTFVGTFALPSLIFMSLAELDLVAVNWTFLLAILIAKTIVFVSVIVVVVLIRRPVNLGRAGIFAIFCTQSNDFAIGYPIVLALYANTHPEYAAYLYLMAPISLAILNPISFVLIEVGKRRNSSTLTATTPLSINAYESIEDQTPPSTNQDRFKLVLSVVKAIFLNPIIFMTILGILGNVLFKHRVPVYLGGTLKVLGSAFSASALFLLGLRMVGKVHKLRGPTLVVPGILIITKLLVLPLVTREVVSLLQPGSNASETLDLSTYGFLYGTFPAAPTLFVFATQYNIDVDLIASAMVACTFISAPWMFVSAQMIALSKTAPADFIRHLDAFTLDVSVAGAAACVAVAASLLLTRRLRRQPHTITAYLLLSQFVSCLGAILWNVLDKKEGSLAYVQFALFTAGVYSSRIWTALLAITLLFLQCRSLCFVLRLQPYFILLGYGVPVVLSVTLLLFDKSNSLPYDKRNPNFVYGVFQAIVAVTLLVICFIVTVGCLILQQRHQKRHERYWTLACDVASSFDPRLLQSDDEEDAETWSERPQAAGAKTAIICPEGYSITPTCTGICAGANSPNCHDCGRTTLSTIEESTPTSDNHPPPPPPQAPPPVSPTTPVPDIEDLLLNSSMNRRRTVSESTCAPADRERCEAAARAAERAAADDRLEPIERDDVDGDEMQILRHIVLLILLLCSMFVGLAISVWTLLVGGTLSPPGDNNGIYVELAFLDAALNSGQSLIVFAVFGLEWRGATQWMVAMWRRWRRGGGGAEALNLPTWEELTVEERGTCEQFRRYHMEKCRSELAKDRRYRMKVYSSVFTGAQLVTWLVGVGVAVDRAAAIAYGRRLLRGRLLRHINSAHHFHDRNLLYTFECTSS